MIAALPLVFSRWIPNASMLSMLLDVIIVSFTLADIFLIPKSGSVFEIERKVNDKLSLGADNPVEVSIRFLVTQPKGAYKAISFTIKDAPPDQFELSGVCEAQINLSEERRLAKLNYKVRPVSKGDFEFGDLFIAIDGLFGLARKVERLPAKQAIKVYPSLFEIQKYDMLLQAGRMMQAGIHHFRFDRGGGEFESLRDYVTGDEYRKIDWGATAKRNKLTIRQYEAERAQNVILAIDIGRSMATPVNKVSKIDYCIEAALMLAHMAAISDDRTGLLIFGADEKLFLPPAKGKGQVYRLVDSLYNVFAQPVESDYGAAFTELVTRWKRRSLVVVFTDLIDPESSDRLIKSLKILESRHRVVCVNVSDPQLGEALYRSPLEESDVYERAVATQVLHERSQAISVLKQRGVVTIDSPPETLSSDLINHYLKLKARSAI
jgi:uncharacterized protein (DUF58 family)